MDKPKQTARQNMIDFTKGVMDRIRDHIKKLEEENASKSNNRRQTSNARIKGPNAR